jgi:6-phosphogluconolactonase (cycloisomerase 2 family)
MNRRVLTLLVSLSASAVITSAAAAQDNAGAVFALTNAVSGNAVVRWGRSADGSLGPGHLFATGEAGSGATLGSQGAVIVSDDHRLLFAVNAGSNSITSFRIEPDGVELADTIASGGSRPISLTFNHGLLYVLNAGSPNTISGFTVDRHGQLAAIANSTRPLSAASTDPAQVNFSDTGDQLIVTEKATNTIDIYTVDDDGVASGPVPYGSAGPTPFGFAVGRGNTVLVSDAGTDGGASSYRIGLDSFLTAVSGNVVSGQQAACWTVITNNGQFGYVSNAASGDVSGFTLGPDGSATLIGNGVSAITGGNPNDEALSVDSRFLYVRVGATRSIAIFRIEANGTLSTLPPFTGTRDGLAGLAAY